MAEKPVSSADQTTAAEVQSNDPVAEAIAALKQAHPDAVQDDTRAGYNGVIIDPDKLVDVATTIRDKLGYDYLSSATAVDYLGNGESILIVDDAPEQRDLAGRMMQRLGYRVTTAASGEAALALIREHTFDLVILDPPSFSSSKRMEGTFDVQRDHPALLRQTLHLLAPDGELLFSTNRRGFRLAPDGQPFEVEFNHLRKKPTSVVLRIDQIDERSGEAK